MRDEQVICFTCIPSLKNLKVIGSLEITDRALWSISRLNNLTDLWIEKCRCITDEGLKSLASLKKLQRLTLRENGTRCNGSFVQFLTDIETLTSLDLWNNLWLTEDVYLQLSRNPKIFQILKCGYSPNGYQ